MRVAKYLLAINVGTLLINGIIVWLTIAKYFPAILGIVLFLGVLGALVWFSCLVNGKLPRRPHRSFYTAETEEIRRF